MSFSLWCSSVQLATLLLLASTAAGAAEPALVDLPKQGNWELNYDPDACHLFGRFGSGSNEVVARFTRHQPSGGFQLTLIGDPVKIPLETAKVTIDFGYSGPQELEPMTGVAGGKPILILGTSLFVSSAETAPGVAAPPDQAAEALVSRLDITLTPKRKLRLQLGRMDAPMAAMRNCVDDLLRSWGYDPSMAPQMKSGPVPIGGPGAWATVDDYPKGAIANGISGLVQFRVDVSEEGLVTKCHVLSKTKPDSFGDLTCELVSRRAKFKPALDSAGKPVKWYYTSRVRWLTDRAEW